jgi:mono/diheme cytochrome c family protein
MPKSLLLTTIVAAAVAVGAGYARQGTVSTSTSKVVIPLERTTPVDGKQMYVNYCAPCHGVDGRGDGPVAPALKQSPTDLTLMSRNNGGKFPGAHIASVLEYGAEIPSHGTADMPVWGPILGKMDGGSPQQRALRINNLRRYLQQMQAQ